MVDYIVEKCYWNGKITVGDQVVVYCGSLSKCEQALHRGLRHG